MMKKLFLILFLLSVPIFSLASECDSPKPEWLFYSCWTNGTGTTTAAIEDSDTPDAVWTDHAPTPSGANSDISVVNNPPAGGPSGENALKVHWLANNTPPDCAAGSSTWVSFSGRGDWPNPWHERIYFYSEQVQSTWENDPCTEGGRKFLYNKATNGGVCGLTLQLLNTCTADSTNCNTDVDAYVDLQAHFNLVENSYNYRTSRHLSSKANWPGKVGDGKIHPNQWNALEIKYYQHDTNGEITVKLNGDLIINATGNAFDATTDAVVPTGGSGIFPTTYRHLDPAVQVLSDIYRSFGAAAIGEVHATGDFDANFTGSVAPYTHSSGSGTLTFDAADFTSALVAGGYYRFCYTLNTVNQPAHIYGASNDDTTMTLTGITDSPISVQIKDVSGTHYGNYCTDFFQVKTSPGDLVLNASSVSSDFFSLDDVGVHGSVLSQPDFTLHSKWSVTGDFDASFTGGKANYTHTSGAGTLTQTAANRNIASPLQGNTAYFIAYTLSNLNGSPTATVSGLTDTSIPLPLKLAGGQTTWSFTTKSSPGDMVITVSSAAGDTFSLDDIDIQPATRHDCDLLEMPSYKNGGNISENYEYFSNVIISSAPIGPVGVPFKYKKKWGIFGG